MVWRRKGDRKPVLTKISNVIWRTKPHWVKLGTPDFQENYANIRPAEALAPGVTQDWSLVKSIYICDGLLASCNRQLDLICVTCHRSCKHSGGWLRLSFCRVTWLSLGKHVCTEKISNRISWYLTSIYELSWDLWEYINALFRYRKN